MARKIKIDNAIIKRLKRKANNDSRKIAIRNPLSYFLIFCEGTKTEPNYFYAIKDELPKGIVTIDIIGTGANTVSLLERAQKYCRTKSYGFDQKWIVFDKDDFSDDQFNEAFFKAKSNGFRVAYSNEAFELWYLLHFEYYNTGISRHQYQEKLSQHLQQEYKKNDPTVYSKLKKLGDQAKAIQNAKKLYDNFDHISPAKENPSTLVHLLVIELNKYLT